MWHLDRLSEWGIDRVTFWGFEFGMMLLTLTLSELPFALTCQSDIVLWGHRLHHDAAFAAGTWLVTMTTAVAVALVARSRKSDHMKDVTISLKDRLGLFWRELLVDPVGVRVILCAYLLLDWMLIALDWMGGCVYMLPVMYTIVSVSTHTVEWVTHSRNDGAAITIKQQV